MKTFFQAMLIVSVFVVGVGGSDAQAGGYVYVANSYYVAPPALIAPVFSAPVPVGLSPVVMVSGYPTYVVPQPPMMIAPVVARPVVAPVVAAPVIVAPTYVAPVYSPTVVVGYGPRVYSYRSVSGPFRSYSREVIRY